MVVHVDPLKSFIPKGDVKFIILGTMVAINGRIIDGEEPTEEVFYYNNNRNHFWRVLQHLMNPKLVKKEDLKKFTIAQKKKFLNDNGIAIINLVKEVTVPKKYKHDPSDTVLFEAYKKDLVVYKSLTPKMKKLIKTKPLFFTCRRKKGIDQLLDGFLEFNKLSKDLMEKVWYWATPTRCNPYQRSLLWRQEANQFLKEISEKPELKL